MREHCQKNVKDSSKSGGNQLNVSGLYMSLKQILKKTPLMENDSDNSLQQKIKVEQEFAVTADVFRCASVVTFIFMKTKLWGVHYNF